MINIYIYIGTVTIRVPIKAEKVFHEKNVEKIKILDHPQVLKAMLKMVFIWDFFTARSPSILLGY